MLHRNHDYISIKEARKILENEKEANAIKIKEMEKAIASYEKVINEIGSKA